MSYKKKYHKCPKCGKSNIDGYPLSINGVITTDIGCKPCFDAQADKNYTKSIGLADSLFAIFGMHRVYEPKTTKGSLHDKKTKKQH